LLCYKLLKTEHLSPKRRRKTKKNFAGNLCPLLPRDTAKKEEEKKKKKATVGRICGKERFQAWSGRVRGDG